MNYLETVGQLPSDDPGVCLKGFVLGYGRHRMMHGLAPPPSRLFISKVDQATYEMNSAFCNQKTLSSTLPHPRLLHSTGFGSWTSI